MGSCVCITYSTKGKTLQSLTTLTQTKCRTIKPELNNIIKVAKHTELSLQIDVFIHYLETDMTDGQRTKHGPLRLSIAITRAKLNLIYLPQKLVADLASAPKLCFENISERRRVRGGKKMMNPFLQGRYQIDVFLTPCRLKKGSEWIGGYRSCTRYQA